MYGGVPRHSLPSYGAGYGYGQKPSKSGGSRVVQGIVVVLLLACGGLGVALLQVRSMQAVARAQLEQHNADLVSTRNLLHRTEAELTHKITDLNTLERRMNEQTLSAQQLLNDLSSASTELVAVTADRDTAQHELQALEGQRTDVRTRLQGVMQSIQDKMKEIANARSASDPTRQQIQAMQKAHTSREEAWLKMQADWERLQREMDAEINKLRKHLNVAKQFLAVEKQWALPRHVAAEDAAAQGVPATPSAVQTPSPVPQDAPQMQLSPPFQSPVQQPAQQLSPQLQQSPPQQQQQPPQLQHQQPQQQQPQQQQPQQQQPQQQQPQHQQPQHQQQPQQQQPRSDNEWHADPYDDPGNWYADYPGFVADAPQAPGGRQRGHPQARRRHLPSPSHGMPALGHPPPPQPPQPRPHDDLSWKLGM